MFGRISVKTPWPGLHCFLGSLWYGCLSCFPSCLFSPTYVINKSPFLISPPGLLPLTRDFSAFLTAPAFTAFQRLDVSFCLMCIDGSWLSGSPCTRSSGSVAFPKMKSQANVSLEATRDPCGTADFQMNLTTDLVEANLGRLLGFTRSVRICRSTSKERCSHPNAGAHRPAQFNVVNSI